jgi:Protein of unknown function (DUF3179)
VVCHSGVGLTPTVDGRTLHFSAGGLYNGLVLLVDDETRTYWDHVTGEAVHGALAGRRLETWSLAMTTAGRALAEEPWLPLSRSRPGLFARAFGRVHMLRLRGRGLMPPWFHRTMGAGDVRRPAMESGLGVVIDGEARFYPLERLGVEGATDVWHGRPLHVAIDPADRFPFAEWEDGTRPFQLFTRWYGFAFTYPGCAVYAPREAAEPRASLC